MNGVMRYILLATGLLAAALAGCVSTGRPLPATALARAQDIPIVPIPPPPIGQPAEAPKAPPVEVVPASATKPASDIPPPAPPPPPAVVDNPPPPSAPTTAVTARQLYQTARERFQHVDSYIVRLIRREVVKGEMNPEEVILFKFRADPWSVYLKWLGKEGQGREVVYVRGRYEGKIHSLLAAGDIPFMPAGKKMSLAPDSFLVKSATRHPITQAGIAATIDKVGEFLAAVERGDRRAGTMVVIGPVQRPEFERPAYAIEHTLTPNFDPAMPGGGKRVYYFDPATGLPTLITARDERGQEVEYYRYDRLQPGVKLDDSDFDPDALWGKPKETAAK
jgi:hypothetical protein